MFEPGQYASEPPRSASSARSPASNQQPWTAIICARSTSSPAIACSGSLAGALERLLDLPLLLGEVDVPRLAGIRRAARTGFDHRRRGTVLAVRRRLDRDEVTSLVAVARVQRLIVRDRLRHGLAIRGRRAVPVVEAAREHDPDPEPARGFDRRGRVVVALRVEVVEVADRRDAVEQHLAEREQRGGRHVRRRRASASSDTARCRATRGTAGHRRCRAAAIGSCGCAC